jgi:hypothetical protein
MSIGPRTAAGKAAIAAANKHRLAIALRQTGAQIA